MEIKRARDILIPLEEYPHVPYWFTLRQALVELEGAELEKHGRRTLPRVALVFDEKYQLLGTIRRRDILRGLEPEFLSNKSMQFRKKIFDVDADFSGTTLTFDMLLKSVRDQSERPVSDMMQIIKTTVNYDDSLLRIIYEMVENNMTVLPVLKDGEVVGIVRTVEVISEVKKLTD